MGRKDFERLPQQERSFWHSAWHLWCCAVCWLCSLPCQRRNLRSLGLRQRRCTRRLWWT